MTARRYLQLDVFASHAGNGNPLGVVFDAHDLSTARMQALASWLNLSETVFFLPPDAPGADYRIRIFTPGSELPFAGHPSVGAAWAAVEAGLCQPRDGALLQQCEAGLLPVRVDGTGPGRRIALRSPRGRRVAGAGDDVPAAVRALAAAGSPIELWNNGPAWWLIAMDSPQQLRALAPDFAAIAAWTDATRATGIAVYAAEPGDRHALAVRAFCPGDAVNVPEDPVTGSANALIAARLSAEGRLPGGAARYVASQGRELGRDGRVEITVDDEGEVWIGGDVQPVIDGQVSW